MKQKTVKSTPILFAHFTTEIDNYSIDIKKKKKEQTK